MIKGWAAIYHRIDSMPDVIFSLDRARKLAESWIAAWNARNLEAIMSHYAEEVVFSSPVVVIRQGEGSGVLHGKAALRHHFRRGLETQGSDLKFTLIDVLSGVRGYTIYYSRETGATVADSVTVDSSGKALQVTAHYNPPR